MTILGLGIDLVEISRLQKSLDQFGESFLTKIFLPSEINYCQAHANPTPHLAARFAAKEALAKALGTGIGEHCQWREIEIISQPNGQPTLLFSGTTLTYIQSRKIRHWFVSLTHTEHYAAAHVLVAGN